jgi:2'-phosphotransferase
MSRDGGIVRLSKSLSWLLRHNAEKEGFNLLEGGYLPVADILRHKRFSGWTEADVRQVVATCEKQRFGLLESDTGQLLIRANQE